MNTPQTENSCCLNLAKEQALILQTADGTSDLVYFPLLKEALRNRSTYH